MTFFTDIIIQVTLMFIEIKAMTVSLKIKNLINIMNAEQ